MLSYAMKYSVVLATLVIGDVLWLSYFAPTIFRPTLGSIMRDPPNWTVAALFYLLYALGVVIFAVAPAYRLASWRTALLYGALLGFFAYMTYDLTNLATIRVWTVRLAVMDVTWGTFVSGLAGLLGYALSRGVLETVR
ncbi:MAG: DUF2177 family protein [Rhizomicrobium sp.]